MRCAHQKTIEAVFAHSTSANIAWKDIGALLVGLGAEVSEREASRVAIFLFNEVRVFHRPHPSPKTDKGAVVSVKKWLEQHGVKSKDMRYATVIEKAEGNFSAYVPDLPGCVATGATVEEVEMEIREAITFHVEGLHEDGLLVPPGASQVEYVEVGDRSPGDVFGYPDDDLKAVYVKGKWQFSHKDGKPYE
jgi:predicted RNase H-like HicB family nuclease